MAVSYKRSEAKTLKEAGVKSRALQTKALQAQKLINQERNLYQAMLAKAHQYTLENGDEVGVVTQVADTESVVTVLPLQIMPAKENHDLTKLYNKQGEETTVTVEVIEEPK